MCDDAFFCFADGSNYVNAFEKNSDLEADFSFNNSKLCILE